MLAIDPGTTQSGWVLLEGREVVQSGVDDNNELLVWVKHGQHADMLAIEMIASMGMSVGQSTFDTVRWIGRFQQAWRDPEAVRFVKRHEVKAFLCNNQRAKDGNVRQALIDLLGAPGRVRLPGPTFGVKSHAWQALGVAVTALSLRATPDLPEIPQPAENVPA